MAAGAFALAGACLAGPLAPQSASAQPAPSGDRFDGVLSVLWGDPQPGSAAQSFTTFTLNYPDGARAPVAFSPELESQAVQFGGKRVTVRGSMSGVPGAPGISATDIEANGLEPLSPAAASGTKKVLYILLKFKGDKQEPFAPSHYRDLTNPMQGSGKIPATINGFYDAVSYGKLKWEATVAGNKWYTLSKTHAEICGGVNPSGGCLNLEDAGDEAMELVKRDVNVKQFDTINFVFNNDLNCCAFGGAGYTYNGRSWAVTWEPPWGQNAGTYAHELGHSLGLPHSGWRYGTYDSNHDQMSRGSSIRLKQCGAYNSVNSGARAQIYCDEPGSGYIMAHQNHLGWIPAANRFYHRTQSTATYDIDANARKLGNKLKVVIVCLRGRPCTTSERNGRFITIEVKTKTDVYDRGVPSQGVIIHDVMMDRGPITGPCYVNPQTGWAMPFDATPGDWDSSTCSGPGLSNMAYAVGRAFNDPDLGVKIEVLKRTADVFRVRVTKSK